jgi:phosphatidylserine/phosphatidylglycerophosphate/cardiolipin synthase-like enzyme
MPRRSRRRAATQSLTTLLLVLVLVIVVYLCRAADLTRLGRPSATSSVAPTAAAVSAVPGAYRLLFTTPQQTAGLDNPTGGIPAEVAATMDAAQKTLDVAVYEFDLPVLAEAMIRAEQRGVRVRLVTDTDSMEEDVVQRVADAGIPVTDDGRAAIMHDKFVVIDGAAVWTGSMNFTRNDAYRNDNNFIYLPSAALAANYTAEFKEMFAGHDFGPTSPANTPNPAVDLGGMRIENYFAPEDHPARQILQVLDSARQSIYFLAFSFTRQDFAEKLLEKAGAGVTVQGVFETRQIAAGSDQAWALLTQGGLAANVRQDGNRFTMHDKVFIVDEATVITGSYNFTRNAEESNDENVVILHSPEIAQAYFVEWQRIWAQAGD